MLSKLLCNRRPMLHGLPSTGQVWHEGGLSKRGITSMCLIDSKEVR